MFDNSPRTATNNEMNESDASGQRNATADVFSKLPGQMTRSRKQTSLSDSKLGPQFIATLAQQLFIVHVGQLSNKVKR